MPLTGRDVWEAILKAGLLAAYMSRRPTGTARTPTCWRVWLNGALGNRENWLSNLLGTEDAMRVWQERTPREYVLQLYRFLNQCGYTVIGIDAAIERKQSSARSIRKPALVFRPA